MWVMLKAAWQGHFGRSVRDLDGLPLIDPDTNEQRRLVFAPGKPRECNGLDFLAIRADIGKALLPVEDYVGGKPVIVDLASLPDDAMSLDEIAEEVRAELLAQPLDDFPPLDESEHPPHAEPGEEFAATDVTEATGETDNGADTARRSSRRRR